MKFLPFLLLFILFSCSSSDQPVKKKKTNAGNIRFFEMYNLSEINHQWLDACKWANQKLDSLALQDGTASNEITTGRFRSLIRIAGEGLIGYVSESDFYAVNEILVLPEFKNYFPKDLTFMWSYKPKEFEPGKRLYALYALKVPTGKKARINGNHILESIPVEDENTAQININITMTKAGAREWESMTRKNLNRFIAITLDDAVLSCPKVTMTIAGGETQVSGDFSMEEAGEISDRINGQ